MITLVFAIVQISIFRALPAGIKRGLAYFPLMTVVVNFLGSFLILMFTGTASVVGVANLFSSVIFGAYVYTYRNVRGIHSVPQGRWRFNKLEEEHPEGWFIF